MDSCLGWIPTYKASQNLDIYLYMCQHWFLASLQFRLSQTDWFILFSAAHLRMSWVIRIQFYSRPLCLMKWMNGTYLTVTFLSDFPNSWICRSIITYLSRGEYFTNWRLVRVKRCSQAAIWGWKSGAPVYAHITAVSPPRPLHLSLLHPPGLLWQTHKCTSPCPLYLSFYPFSAGERFPRVVSDIIINK